MIPTQKQIKNKMRYIEKLETFRLFMERTTGAAEVKRIIIKRIIEGGTSVILSKHYILAIRFTKLIKKFKKSGWILSYKNRRSPYNDFVNYDLYIKGIK